MSSSIAMTIGLQTLVVVSYIQIMVCSTRIRYHLLLTPCLVLFYFMQSPFFDKTSNNSSLWVQSVNTNDVANTLGTREAFEGRLRSMQGLEFVVAHDPLQSSVQIPTADGGSDWSNVWVIKKQDRRKRQGQPDELTVLGFYYIVNNAIYMAPTVGKVIGNRMVRSSFSSSRKLDQANFHSFLPLFQCKRRSQLQHLYRSSHLRKAIAICL